MAHQACALAIVQVMFYRNLLGRREEYLILQYQDPRFSQHLQGVCNDYEQQRTARALLLLDQ